MASWNPGSDATEETEASSSKSTPLNVKASDFDFGPLIRLLDPDDLRYLYDELSIDPRDVDTAETNARSSDVGIQARAVLLCWKRAKSHEATRQAILDALERIDNIKAKENLEDIWNGRDIQKTSYKDFYDSIKSLESEQLAGLYQSLGLTPAEVDRAKMKEQSRDIYLKARSVIKFWKKKNGKKASLEVLHERCRQLQTSEKEPSRDVPSFDLQSVKKQLQEEYIQTRGKLPLLPGMPEEFAKIEDIFVDLKIIEEDKKPTGVMTKELKSYGELVCIQQQIEMGNKKKESRIVKRILVRGDPGAGKSSTISKLAYDWACGNQDSPISDFQLVFAITINEINQETDLIGIIQDQLLPKVSKKGLEDYLQSNASLIVILLDGYDEASQYFHQSKDIKYVLCSKWLAEACVIVTTRPNQVSEFNQNYGPYVQVVVSGFSQGHIKEYVDKFMQFQTGNASAVLCDIYKSPQLSKLSSIPIILSILCLIWVDDRKLPNTVTALYKEVIMHLGEHAYKKKSGDSFKELDVEKWSERVLNNIGKVALEGLFDDILVFESSEFEKRSLEEACLLGLVTKETKRLKRNVTCNVTFQHKTFQEISAAYYWTRLTKKDEFERYMKRVNSNNVFQMEYLLRFACGLSVKATETMLPHIVQSLLDHASSMEVEHLLPWPFPLHNLYQSNHKLMPIFLLYEAEVNNAGVGCCKKLLIQLAPLFKTLSIPSLLQESQEFQEVLTTYNTHCEEDAAMVSIKPTYIDKAITITLNPAALSYCIPTTSISEFHLNNVKCVTDKFAQFLSCMSSLAVLMLDDVSLYGEMTTSVHLPRVEKFHLSNCNVTSLFKIFMQSSSSFTSFSELHCHQVQCNTDQFAQFLSCMSSISVLELQDVSLHGELTTSVNKLPTVKILHLKDSNVTSLFDIFLLSPSSFATSSELHCHQVQCNTDQFAQFLYLSSLAVLELNDVSLNGELTCIPRFPVLKQLHIKNSHGVVCKLIVSGILETANSIEEQISHDQQYIQRQECGTVAMLDQSQKSTDEKTCLAIESMEMDSVYLDSHDVCDLAKAVQYTCMPHLKSINLLCHIIRSSNPDERQVDMLFEAFKNIYICDHRSMSNSDVESCHKIDVDCYEIASSKKVTTLSIESW